MSEAKDIQELFERALQLPESARRSFVIRSGSLPAVQSAVIELLSHLDDGAGFLERPAVETFSSLASSATGKIAEFRLVRELGRGGMGVVFLAEDSTLDRRVAVKVLGNHLVGSPPAVARFQREAKAAARLSHPAIVPVYRYGEENGTHFIAMEYVEGETLEGRIKALRASRPSDPSEPEPKATRLERQRPATHAATASTEYVRECLRITSIVAQGLDAAHQAGVVHCDVKPSNILIDRAGQPRITDFGIARLAASDRLTRSGDLAGSLQYMSPEQLSSSELDRRTDVFSLGVVLYEMLTLRPPFYGEDLPAIVDSVRTTLPLPVKRLNPVVSPDLETICQKALEKKPGDRYPTAAHLAADLLSHLRGEPILAKPPTVSRRLLRWMARRRTQSLVTCVVLLLASLSVAGGMQIRSHYQTLAMISVDVIPPVSGSSMFVRRWNSALQTHDAPELVGDLPIVDQFVEPGSVRFVVVSGEDGLAEFDAVLVAGDARAFVLPVVDATTAGAGMIPFPAGTYTLRPILWMTETQDQSFELEAFLLDQLEVSNAQYKGFVDQTGHPPPEHWIRFGYDPALAQRPVVGITRADAEAYARWCGKRLPTSAEWEAAARSPDARLHPWGDSGEPPSVLFPTYDALLQAQATDYAEKFAEYAARTADVGVDVAPHTVNGLHHLLGNVMELTSTVMDHDANFLVIRGGSWVSNPNYVSLREVAISPRDAAGHNVGFRCARSLDMAAGTFGK